jgi:hypothetical protein
MGGEEIENKFVVGESLFLPSYKVHLSGGNKGLFKGQQKLSNLDLSITPSVVNTKS